MVMRGVRSSPYRGSNAGGGGGGGGASDEPVYTGTGQTLIHAGDASNPLYVDPNTAGATGNGNSTRFVPVGPLVRPGGVDADAQFTTGKGGVGKAMRVHYRASGPSPDQPGPEWYLMFGGSIAATKTRVMRAQIRLGGAFTTNIAIKFFYMIDFNVPGGQNPLWCSHAPPAGYAHAKTTFFQAYSNGVEDTVDFNQATQPVGPYFEDMANDGLWHRFTWSYKPHSASGVYDGHMRLWIDGTKVVDLSAAAAGVTPPGATKSWCALWHVQQMLVATTADPTYTALWGGPQSSYNVPAHDQDINIGDGNPLNLDTAAMWTF